MNPYLKELTHLISNCEMTTTYKMSWARAITEYLVTNPQASQIHFDDLSPFIFKYYWNQIVFFDLKQSPDSTTPKICQIVKNEIDKKVNFINTTRRAKHATYSLLILRNLDCLKLVIQFFH